jgi:putative photosynthetic complex assembly protein
MNHVHLGDHDLHGDIVPRPALIAVGVLLALVIVGAGITRWMGLGAVGVPDATALHSADLAFSDHADGSIAIERVSDHAAMPGFAPGTNGFARGVLRALSRERRLNGIDAPRAFRMTRWSDGRLTIEDPATGTHIELNNFGPTNEAVFAALYDAATDFRGNSP